ncbi:MAG: hypothetical protein ACOVOF_04770 [Chryseotalea sp.]|jgi:hypothetical protein|nr:hypothetical protein [Flammeovirgaceae bacterium]MCZ8023830.1 hypothetical protein [Cytophagales bacterium]
MKTILTLIFSFLSLTAAAQVEQDNKQKIQQVLNTFMRCISNKDSTTFYSLFHQDPVVWIGVFGSKTTEYVQKQDKNFNPVITDNYTSFFRSLLPINAEEKFYNTVIVEDGYIASVTFDYSFWQDRKKLNWGKESWGMIKVKDQWKISSVIFSMEYEAIKAEKK